MGRCNREGNGGRRNVWERPGLRKNMNCIGGMAEEREGGVVVPVSDASSESICIRKNRRDGYDRLRIMSREVELI